MNLYIFFYVQKCKRRRYFVALFSTYPCFQTLYLFLVTVCSFGDDTLCDENRSDCPLVYNEEWGKILILIPHIKKS